MLFSKNFHKKGMFVSECMLNYSHSLGVKLNLQIFYLWFIWWVTMKWISIQLCWFFLMKILLSYRECKYMHRQIKIMKNVNKGFPLYLFHYKIKRNTNDYKFFKKIKLSSLHLLPMLSHIFKSCGVWPLLHHLFEIL